MNSDKLPKVKAINEKVPQAQDKSHSGFGFRNADSFKDVEVEGHLIATLVHNSGQVEVRDLGKNIITNAASVLLAQLINNNMSVAYGAFGLAVGTGEAGWNLLPSPPAATATQTQLFNELFRKQFQSTAFVATVQYPTPPSNVLDLTTFFAESEAVGALTEMGLVGGNASLTANTGTLINYRTFPVINKPNTATLTITWRLTF